MNGKVVFAVMSTALLLVSFGQAAIGQEIQLATDRPKPNAPDESVRLFRVPPEIRVEVVASEPHLADPVAIDFDARGRIFVAELHGYNLEGYWDIIELNRSGVLDTEVRRIDATKEAQQRAAKGQYGTVKLLEDTDGDGRMDKSSVWADRLHPCYGVVAARDGVIAVCPPDILFLADRDGDGRAEICDKLYSTAGGPMWNRPSNPRWNLDNWIYFDGGARFQPDGSKMEPATGSGQFGQAVSDWGDRFFCVQVQPARLSVPLPYRYLIRNPFHAVEADSEGLIHYKRVFPTSRPHPWRVKRSEDPAWMEFYGAAEATANGFWTAACGPEIYRSTELPSEYHGNYFICENAQNFINRNLLERDGAGYRIRRVASDIAQRREFLTSTEQWFRPVNLKLGPDGGLYIVDMYREIIEDYSAIPRFLQQQYVESLIAGSDRGRIYRIVAHDSKGWRPFDLNQSPTSELVEHLASPNAWWRETAQRLLVERADLTCVESLVQLVRKGKTAQARLHALYTLGGLSALRIDCVCSALHDPHFAVRLHALRLSERFLDRAHVVTEVLDLANDSDPAVRLQLALTLGECDDSRTIDAVARLAMKHGNDKWMSDAILSSTERTAGQLFETILQLRDSGQAEGILRPLAAAVGARQDPAELVKVLAQIAAMDDARLAQLGELGMVGLVEGIKRGTARPLKSTDGQIALAKLMGASSARIRACAIEIAGLVRLQEGEVFERVVSDAAATARDNQQDVAARVSAIRILRSAPFAQLERLAVPLLDSRQPPEVQLALINSLAADDNPRVADRLLDNWPSYTPKIRQTALEAIFGHKNRLPVLLDALQHDRVPVSALTAMQRIELREHTDRSIQLRAQSILGSQSRTQDLKQTITRYRNALSKARDTEHGKKVFAEQCAKCHTLEKQGYDVGPDLATVVNRADETLISDVLEPSREITIGFEQYRVLTETGRIFTGVLAAETATSIKLRKEEGEERTILRRNIDEMAASSLSMMPEDIEKEISPLDLACLIAYLRRALGPLVPPAVTLFDENRELIALLTQGTGVARIELTECFSGQLSLAVSPPQRYSDRVPGWSYRIAEKPGPGEYRYLRFAWKAPAATGAMLELAADGQWPPADRPLRRYYSGQNTTSWQAIQISDKAPRQWVVVIRDLWKDFGAFTLTGFAPTAMGGEVLFDRIQLLRSLDGEVQGGRGAE